MAKQTAVHRHPWTSLVRFALLFLVAMLVQFLALNRATGPYDEFLSLYGAERVLHGGLPYRDFFTMYGPAQFYLIAGFFKLFGVSALSGRIYDALIRAAIVCAVYALTVSLTSRRWAIAAFSVTLLWLACDRNPAYNYSAYPALLASLLSCIFFSRFLHHRQKSQLLLAGILASIAATFRHDCGVYLSVTHLVLLAWIVRLDRRSTEPVSTTLTRLLRLALPYLGCVLLIAVPVYLAMLVGVGFQNIFFDLVYSPGFIYPKFRNMPFLDPDAVGKLHHPFNWTGRQGVETLVVFFPLLAILSASLCLLTTRRSHSRIFAAAWQRQTFALLLVLGSLFFIKGLIRVSPVQLMQSIVVGIILLAVLLGQLSRIGGTVRLSLYASALYLAVCTLPLALDLFADTRGNLSALLHPHAPNSFYSTCHPPPGLARLRCLTFEPDEASVAEEVERRTVPGDKIFVGAGRHDRVFWSDVRLYFVTEHPAVTKWAEFDPGVLTTLPVQNEIIDSIRRDQPKVIVLNANWDNNTEPNQSRFSSGVTALDDYIHSHYTPRATYGLITVLTPNGSDPSDRLNAGSSDQPAPTKESSASPTRPQLQNPTP